ncbi:MAG: OadG family protein [Fusobacteriaceae bacterium]
MNSLFGAEISVYESIIVTAICMGIVFSVLMVISGILTLFKFIPAEVVVKKKIVENTKIEDVLVEKRKKVDVNEIKEEKMVIAMLVASMEAAAENENAYIRVKSIREL